MTSRAHLVHEKWRKEETIPEKLRGVFLFDWSFKKREHEKKIFIKGYFLRFMRNENS